MPTQPVLFHRTFRYTQVLAVFFASLSLVVAARAERILFQRGTALYVAGRDGKGARRLFEIGKPLEAVWAVSSDGHRIAWFAPVKVSASFSATLHSRPVGVWISDLSGVHSKRLLTTDTLHDRQGKRVTKLFVGDGAVTEDGTGFLQDWAPDPLSAYSSETSARLVRFPTGYAAGAKIENKTSHNVSKRFSMAVSRPARGTSSPATANDGGTVSVS